MSVMEGQLDPPPDVVECEFHHWIYPAGSICQACLTDIKDDYADHAIAKERS